MEMLNNLEIRIEVDKLKRAMFDLEIRVKYLEYLNRFKQVPIGKPITNTGDMWDRIIYGNGVFVANTESGHDIMGYSGDGVHWYESSDRVEGTPCNFAYHNGIFVAVGTERFTVYNSYDGIRWEKNENMSNMKWYDVIYGDKFVMFGYGGEPYYAWSEDGINWEIGINNTSGGPEFMAYGNGIYIGWKHDRYYVPVYSKDGKTWEQINYTFNGYIEEIQYMNGIYVATIADNEFQFAYSKNGIDWLPGNNHTEATNISWYALGHSNNMFVCSGVTPYPEHKVGFAYSKNGIDWYLGTSTFENQTTQITYGNNIFIGICGDFPYMVYSKNGIDWYKAKGFEQFEADENYLTVDRIAYGNNRFVIVIEEPPFFAYSDDGINWKHYEIPEEVSEE